MYRRYSPIPGPEAFEERGKDAELSQAAFVLAAGGGVAGYAAHFARASAEFPLPEMAKLHRKTRLDVERAMRYVDADPADLLEQPDLRIAGERTAPLARDLIDRPDAVRAASLVEACMHSPSRLVRTAAAASALDTTGPREDVVAVLEDGAGRRDELIRDIARTALARVDPGHPKLQRLRGRRAQLHGVGRESHTAVITHGTFAARTRWWKPNGNFYNYVDGIQPSLHLHHTSFQWTGNYSPADRDDDAALLVDWIADQHLDTPDFIAHSHGGTVANLATRKGARFRRLILLSWPVHRDWFPKFTNVERLIDIRVRYDLVIMADRGGQLFKVRGANAGKIESHVHGWFSHGNTRDPGYWQDNSLPDALKP